MVTNFNRKDLVSFGTYLLSEKRQERLIASFEAAKKAGMKNPVHPVELSNQVHHADIENWLEEVKNEKPSSKLYVESKQYSLSVGMESEEDRRGLRMAIIKTLMLNVAPGQHGIKMLIDAAQRIEDFVLNKKAEE